MGVKRFRCMNCIITQPRNQDLKNKKIRHAMIVHLLEHQLPESRPSLLSEPLILGAHLQVKRSLQ